jgi:hypothetical protein
MLPWTVRTRPLAGRHERRAPRRERRRRPALEALDSRVLLAATPPMQIGMNINSVDYWTHALMFNDIMKYTQDGWSLSYANAVHNYVTGVSVTMPAMDSNSYPLGLGNLPSQGYALSTGTVIPYPVGTYSLIFDGNGTVVVSQGGGLSTTVSQSGGTGSPHPVNIINGTMGIYIGITASDSVDNVRNIRLIMPGYVNTYQAQPFYTPFLQGLQPLTGPLRFMDTMKTNGQALTDWSQRTTTTYMTQTKSTGVAVEYMVDLANATGRDMWVNMPYQADDAYVQNFAQYVHDHLNAGLKVYVEYGNEDWNNAGICAQAYNYVDAYAQAHGLNHDQATADLSTHVWNIWLQVYGAQASATVVRVAAVQLGGPTTLNDELQRFAATAAPTDPNQGFDIISGAPYYSPDPTNYTSSTTSAQIATDAKAAAIAIDTTVDAFAAVRNKWQQAQGRHIPIFMYEAGYGLDPHGNGSVPWYQAYLNTQTDPGMYAATQAYIDGLRQHGVDGMVYYSYIYPFSLWGPWGSMDATGEATTLTPIYNALHDYATGQLVLPAISSLSITGLASSAPAGFAQTITVTAHDPSGNVATDYLGTIHFTSTDPQAVLPADYMFTPADKGVHTFTVVLSTAGTQSVTATDIAQATIAGTQANVSITALAASTFGFSGFPASTTAGTTVGFTVTALDAYGNIATSYTKTIHFTSNDVQAILPADYTFTTADQGAHTFTATFLSSGTRFVTATDTASPSVTGVSPHVSALAGPLNHLQFSSMPFAWSAGTPQSFRIIAADVYGNGVPSYAGTVHFTSSDPLAILPADYTYTAADAGMHTFTATLKTVGPQGVTVTDTVSGLSAGESCVVASAKTLSVTGYPTATTAGVAHSFTVTAHDTSGNVVTNYAGTVHFTSSDPYAVLPANYTFTAADAGVHTFTATLKAVGVRSLVATDTAGSSITGAESITVSPGPFNNAHINYISPTTAGVAHSFTVAARDAYTNVITTYTGTVHFSSSDPLAVLPADYTFTAADQGFHTFSAGTLKTAGGQYLTASDAAAGITSSINTTVKAAATAGLAVTSSSSTAVVGTAQSITVTAIDAYGNFSYYLGTVHFSSSDPQAVLPANYTFTINDAGSHTFTVTFKTSGTQSITATDNATSSITGSKTITVNPVGGITLSVAGFPSSTTAGAAQSFTVTAKNANGNVMTSYTGTVHFTSSDAQAALPANYTFTAADAGTHTFSATLATAGTQSLTAIDTGTSTITGSQSGITVSPAAASTLTVAGFPASAVAGASQSFTVTAKDPYGNIATGYTGTVHFTSSDILAVLPANYAYTAADAGVHTFSASLATAGTQSITATDTVTSTIIGSQSGITVTSTASALSVTGFPSTTTAGVTQSFTVTAKNASGGIATGYTGTVHFTSNDSQAVLPANYTFTAADAGVHTFTITLKTAGSRSITVTDTATATLTATQSSINVNPGPFSNLNINGYPSPTMAGVSHSFTITARDAYTNPITNYAGTVHFTSTDQKAILPADYTFTAADGGAHTFSGATLESVGYQYLKATDAAAAITGSTGANVVAAVAAGLTVTGYPSIVTAGTAANFTVTLYDAYGNIATGYTGTIHFSSDDPLAILPADYTFTATDTGKHTFTATFKAKGTHYLQATDTSNASLTGTESGIQVQ